MKRLLATIFLMITAMGSAFAADLNCKIAAGKQEVSNLGTGSYMPIDVKAFYDANDKLLMASDHSDEFGKYFVAHQKKIKRERSGSLMLFVREIYSDRTLVVKYANSLNIENLIEIPLIESRMSDAKLQMQLEPEVTLVCH